MSALRWGLPGPVGRKGTRMHEVIAYLGEEIWILLGTAICMGIAALIFRALGLMR